MRNFYIRLAVSNVKNNKSVYYPFFLTNILSVMIFYVMASIQNQAIIETPDLPAETKRKGAVKYLYFKYGCYGHCHYYAGVICRAKGNGLFPFSNGNKNLGF